MNSNCLALYFIMGSPQVIGNPLYLLETALKKGITLFQFREKGENALTGQLYLNFARACQDLCKQFNVPFIVNDNIELALKLKADGIHVGTTDLPLPQLKKIIPNSMLIGYSTHTFLDLQHAIEEKVDYVGIGPIFTTTSKKDAQTALGTSFLKTAQKFAQQMPMVAIGGINRNNFKEVLQTGVNGIAVISEICQNPNFITEYLEYYQYLNQPRKNEKEKPVDMNQIDEIDHDSIKIRRWN